MYQIQVLLIFFCRGCPKADGIPEIICRKPRHDGIKINDTQSSSCLAVKQNIVKLCVIVGHTKRKNAFFLFLYQNLTVLLPFQNKPDLRPAGSRSVFQISLKSCLKSPEPFHCIVEIRDRLIQPVGRVISKLFQKMSEAAAGLIELLRFLHQLIAFGIRDEVIAPPWLSCTVLKIIASAFCLNVG